MDILVPYHFGNKCAPNLLQPIRSCHNCNLRSRPAEGRPRIKILVMVIEKFPILSFRNSFLFVLLLEALFSMKIKEKMLKQVLKYVDFISETLYCQNFFSEGLHGMYNFMGQLDMSMRSKCCPCTVVLSGLKSR